MENTPKISRETCTFTAPAAFAVSGEGDQKKRTFDILAYDGGIVTEHGYWSAVVFDTATTASRNVLPVLYEHKSPAGFGSIAVDGASVRASGSLISSEEGQKVAKLADEGYPWEASLYIVPGRVEEVAAGATVEVNGQQFTGPLHVFRDNTIREVSFVAVGAARNTSATIFSAAPVAAQPTEDVQMSDALKAELAELQAKFTATQTQLTEAIAAREAAEAKIASAEAAARTEAVKALFSAIGREFNDEAAAPYVSMPEAQFSAVAADLKAMFAVKPQEQQAPEYLFQAQATQGNTNDPDDAERIARYANGA